MIARWLAGLLRRRTLRIGGASAGIALLVALTAGLLSFLVESRLSMTDRAVSAVPIDWQVEASPGADPAALTSAIGQAIQAAQTDRVGYAQFDGLSASTGGTVQTTGPGKALGLPQGYLEHFPAEVRLLAGSLKGPVLAQQTAANLHAAPGDTISIARIGVPPATLTITGIVELPDADALFQGVGLPAQASPQAPPDNVVLLDRDLWNTIFEPQQQARPDTVRDQIHVRIERSILPRDPNAAWLSLTDAQRNFEARVAGQALVSNNIAARLDSVRGDSLYATVLFLFLGVPGIALAALLTTIIISASRGQRRVEASLLRIRGAQSRAMSLLVAAEGMCVWVLGTGVGLGLAVLIAWLAFPGSLANSWPVFALVGIATLPLVLATYMLPLRRDMSDRWVLAGREPIEAPARHAPVWRRIWLDLILLAAAGLTFWQSASTGYQVVLAPEGVAAVSVDYYAFLAPAFFLAGASLLAARIGEAFISGNGAMLKTVLGPLTGGLTSLVSSTLAHQSTRVTRGIGMTALAVAFAVSTSIFDSTYNAQARVDAELTNGADVTVFGTSDAPAGDELIRIAAAPGVERLAPMQHRFAYVGSDLQDLYGIDPKAIGTVTTLADAYFSGGTAATLLDKLSATPDGVLVSEETVQDFQLTVGDQINLRLMNAADHQYRIVPFTFIGVAREFPTAPKDSFLVANASYVSKMTGSAAQEYVLVRAARDPAEVSATISQLLSDRPSLKVKDVNAATHLIGSNLAAVDLSGITLIELIFGVVMAAGAGGLVLAMGFFERQRSFAVLSVVGARAWQARLFLSAEGLLIAGGGLALGFILGGAVAEMLVKLLTGVFDPPPETLVVPLGYLAIIPTVVLISIAAAVWIAAAASRRDAQDRLRDLL